MEIFSQLLKSIITQKYKSFTVSEFINIKVNNIKKILLRHDVDKNFINSYKISKLENTLNLCGTYYFRIIPESFNHDIMNKIAKLGHEIGYHYEDVDLVIKRQKINVNNKIDREVLIDLAYESFCKNLEMFRKNYDIKTICMHGSPRSKYDNKIIWEKYNYKNLGIICEPYFDINWNEFGYLTDTGRRWNGEKYSIRDKVDSKNNLDFKTTQDIINNINKLPDKLMITIHPQRWTDEWVPWTRELVWQNVKNVVKYLKVKKL